MQLKQWIIIALLKQAEADLQVKRYGQALANCDEVLKLDGNILQVTPIVSQAWAALSQLAMTADELDGHPQLVRLPDLDRPTSRH